MSIKDFLEKIKPFYTILILIVVASIFFALGRLSVLEERQTPIKIEYPERTQTASTIEATITGTAAPKTQKDSVVSSAADTGSDVHPTGGGVVGSKTGKKYYFPWCGTIKRTKPENQVQFASIDAARAAGYIPGGNCKGLK